MGILCLVQQVADQIGEFLLRLSFSGAAGPVSDVLHLTLNPTLPPYPCLPQQVYSKFQIFQFQFFYITTCMWQSRN